MSRENVEVVRAMHAAYASGQPEAALDFFDPAVEFDVTDRPDGRVWQGREGVHRAMTEWTGAFEGWGMEIERLVAAGADKVLVLWREWGRGKTSGAALDQRGGNVLTVADGRIVHAKLYLHRAEALEAVGLRE